MACRVSTTTIVVEIPRRGVSTAFYAGRFRIEKLFFISSPFNQINNSNNYYNEQNQGHKKKKAENVEKGRDGWFIKNLGFDLGKFY